MYNFICDADALIKLAQSGMLPKLCASSRCFITNEVKMEAIDEGKKRLYPDAERIERLFQQGLLQLRNPKTPVIPDFTLGKGESSVFNLSQEVKDLVIVTDDQAFIQELEKHRAAFVVPTDVIVLLWASGKIEKEEAREYLAHMKVFIRQKDYQNALQRLEET